jgi:energy-coupling factor transporter ATP-binding protein EcfA2
MDDDLSSEGVVLVMGVTGAGKSYFVNQLKGYHAVQEGHSLNSETTECQAVRIILDDSEERSISVVDTPGFDDTERSHGEVLSKITEFLAVQHALGIPLRGILYLHKITDNKMTGSALTYLRLFRSLCGDDALKNVILVTTMWNKMRDEDTGEALRREDELLDNFWKPMVNKGSYVAQFDGTSDTAFALIWQLAGKEGVVLKIQKEIVDQDMEVLHTAAGQNLLEMLEMDKVEYEVRIKRLESLMEKEEERGNRAGVKALRRQKADVEAILKRIERSIDKMKVRPGSKMKERIKAIINPVADYLTGPGAVTTLVAVLNITLFVVRVVVGGP